MKLYVENIFTFEEFRTFSKTPSDSGQTIAAGNISIKMIIWSYILNWTSSDYFWQDSQNCITDVSPWEHFEGFILKITQPKQIIMKIGNGEGSHIEEKNFPSRVSTMENNTSMYSIIFELRGVKSAKKLLENQILFLLGFFSKRKSNSLKKCFVEIFALGLSGENHSLPVEKQESFVRFYMLQNTFWMILDDSYRLYHA